MQSTSVGNPRLQAPAPKLPALKPKGMSLTPSQISRRKVLLDLMMERANYIKAKESGIAANLPKTLDAEILRGENWPDIDSYLDATHDWIKYSWLRPTMLPPQTRLVDKLPSQLPKRRGKAESVKEEVAKSDKAPKRSMLDQILALDDINIDRSTAPGPPSRPSTRGQPSTRGEFSARGQPSARGKFSARGGSFANVVKAPPLPLSLPPKPTTHLPRWYPSEWSKWEGYDSRVLWVCEQMDQQPLPKPIVVEKMVPEIYNGDKKHDLGLCLKHYTKGDQCPLTWMQCPLRHCLPDETEEVWMDKGFLDFVRKFIKGPALYDSPKENYNGRPREREDGTMFSRRVNDSDMNPAWHRPENFTGKPAKEESYATHDERLDDMCKRAYENCVAKEEAAKASQLRRTGQYRV
ncbi:hypothetical protein P280DRAFT_472631 [Massarina eburnea CBS 473.64]|uniref:C3H1-type domain-containing protein n=1 Tax=Massarina eburnea CBS 473.64 TaxID=1395130 RepID=A0A6A6RSW2_9PLEO|nr:hypothetical protein P280DRAFT_472631 [Massarina eburnea CBS 473.64]